MRDTRGGYTIIEVLIFLAVSGALFFAVTTLFNGKQGRTQFSQAMRDVDSQIREYVNDVTVSTYPGDGQYNCTISGGKPVLSSGGGGIATNGQCMFLGKALLAVPSANPGQIRVYTVLGARLNGGTPVTAFATANPNPADGNGGSPDITESYQLQSGATIKWSRVSSSLASSPPGGPETDLVGFYNSLQPSGSGSLVANSYGGSMSTAAQIRNALQTTAPTKMQSWFLCFASATSNETALLSVNASSAGITTKLDYRAC